MTSDAASRPQTSISAIAAFVFGVILLALHMTVRLFGAFEWDVDGGDFDPGLLFGALGLLSVVPILICIVLGHVGFAATRTGRKRGRTLAVAGVTLGYALFVLYLNRIVVVILLASQSGEWTDLVTNFFWWA